MYIQNVSAIEKQVKNYIKRNSNPSLVTLYKKFRSNLKIDDIGDYELLCYLIEQVKRYLKKNYNRRQLLKAINLDEDIKSLPKKEKFEVLNYLVEYSQKTAIEGFKRPLFRL